MVSIKHLKKGDPLVKEGEMSNSMYWVQSGTLRLFKKKGSGFIELGVVHSGEVVGEMSFLDNQPRSASVEALQPCDIVEIPRGKFDEFIAAQPSWMKSLISTLVKRLRSTNNRVRELEDASMVYSKDDQGRTSKIHEFLSTSDTLKLGAALLLAASRNGERTADLKTKVKAGWLQFYGAQIMGLHLSKVQAFTDVLNEAGVLQMEKAKDMMELVVLDLDRLERYIYFCHEESAKPDDKQLAISEKGIAVLDAVNAYSEIAKIQAGTETVELNMEEIFQKAVAAQNQKIPFEWSAFEELSKWGFSGDVRVSGNQKTAEFQVQKFQRLYPLVALRQKFDTLNSQKRAP
ncbi:MAG: Crp/Fnr family transcriptional regulator [Bacteriovoracia bacterium]